MFRVLFKTERGLKRVRHGFDKSERFGFGKAILNNYPETLPPGRSSTCFLLASVLFSFYRGRCAFWL